MSSLLIKNIGTLVTGKLESPSRSLAEMAGKAPSDYRQSVMDLVREGVRRELEQKGYRVALPEDMDARFPPLSSDPGGAARVAREGKLSGLVFVGEIRRWEGESQQFVRVFADFKLVRIEDGAVLWDRRVQRAVSTPSATYLGQAYMDSPKIVAHDLFA